MNQMKMVESISSRFDLKLRHFWWPLWLTSMNKLRIWLWRHYLTMNEKKTQRKLCTVFFIDCFDFKEETVNANKYNWIVFLLFLVFLVIVCLLLWQFHLISYFVLLISMWSLRLRSKQINYFAKNKRNQKRLKRPLKEDERRSKKSKRIPTINCRRFGNRKANRVVVILSFVSFCGMPDIEFFFVVNRCRAFAAHTKQHKHSVIYLESHKINYHCSLNSFLRLFFLSSQFPLFSSHLPFVCVDVWVKRNKKKMNFRFCGSTRQNR